jgi:hypothetical protein
MALNYPRTFETRPIHKTFLIAFGIGMYVCSTAICTYAGTISLQTTSEARVVDGKISLTVTVINRGDEVARKLRIYPEVQGLKLQQQSFTSIPAGETISANWKQALPGWPPGTYTAVVRVDFADSAGEPSTALSFSTFPYQQTSRSEIDLETVSLSLEDEAELQFMLKNNGNAEKRLSLRLVLPGEIRCASPIKTVALPGLSEVGESFSLTRVAGRAGDTYPVILLARYLDGGKHHSVAVAAEVSLLDSVPFIRRHRVKLAVITTLLFLTFLGMQFKGRRHESPSDKS